jgi:hypothetical protein
MTKEQIERMLYMLDVVDEATSTRYLSLIARTFVAAQLRDFVESLDLARDQLACWGI